MSTLASSVVLESERHGGERRAAMSEAAFMELDGVHAEWVDGYALFKSPVSMEHDDLRNWLAALLMDLCEAKDLGKIHGDPFVTRLPSARVRSPDLMFIGKANFGRLERNRLVGPPDVAFEIVSPESVSRDYREKFADYEAAGVKEYWILDPVSERFEMHRLEGTGRYQEVPADGFGRVSSAVITGFFFEASWLRPPLPRRSKILREMGVTEL